MANRTSVMIGSQSPSSYNQNCSISARSRFVSANSLDEAAHNERPDYPFISVHYVGKRLHLVCRGQESENT